MESKNLEKIFRVGRNAVLPVGRLFNSCKMFFVLALTCGSSISVLAENYLTENVEFFSHKTRLSGSLVFPKDEPYIATVVFVHGSGKQQRNMHWAKRFAEEGIVALVYDKRGVGQSQGDFESKQSVSEKNIRLLADDASAAMDFLSKHPKTKGVSKGLTGISQAGWIVPLAAKQNAFVDFMVLWSGPVCKVSEEDIYSRYTTDLDGQRVPSYEEALNARKVPYVWPDFLGEDTDSSKHLQELKIPGLWVFGAMDGSVPVDLSVERLQQLAANGHKYEYVLFSHLGHNNMPETFATVVDWIRRLNN